MEYPMLDFICPTCGTFGFDDADCSSCTSDPTGRPTTATQD
jgi:hypothetical protein